LFFVYSYTDNYSSTHYGIYCKDKKFYIEQCQEIILPDINDSHLKRYCTFGSYNNKVKIFDFKLFKYVFNQEKNSFSSLKFKIKATNENIHEYFTKGLNSLEFSHQTNIFGKCDIDIVVNSVFSLILKELSDPFYIFQIFSIVLWLVEGYYNYSAVLIMTTVISITIAIKETRSNLLNIKKMAKYSCNINVFRVNENGQKVEIRLNSTELVPGDLFELPEDEKVLPCDAILLNGSVIVNESVLTGESTPILKSHIHNSSHVFNSKKDKKKYLICRNKNYPKKSIG